MTYGYYFECGNTSIAGEGFDTKEEAHARMWNDLDAFGYKLPKWYEFWRWMESRPAQRPKANDTPQASPAQRGDE